MDLARSCLLFEGLSADLKRIANSENKENENLRIRARYFFVHTLLNDLELSNSQQMQILNSEWSLIYQSGKILFDDDIVIHFNWTHCEDFIALAFSEDPIGVDAEKKSPRHKLWQAELKTKKIFTESERQNLLVADSEEKFWELFFVFWTQKESILKLHRLGLTGLSRLNEGLVEAKKTESFLFEKWVLSVSSNSDLEFRIHTQQGHQV